MLRMGINSVQQLQKMSLGVGNEDLGTHTIAFVLIQVLEHIFYIYLG